MNYTFADNNILQRVAKEANVSTDWIEAFEKEAGSRMSRFVSSLVSQRLVDRILKDERGYIDEKIYLDYLVLIVAQIADEGDVVILGRGSQYILDDHPDAIHVLLIDDVENRVKFMEENYNLSKKRAAQVVADEDKRRLSLYRRLGKSDYDDPGLYHLVINMGKVGLNRALDLVCSQVPVPPAH